MVIYLRSAGSDLEVAAMDEAGMGYHGETVQVLPFGVFLIPAPTQAPVEEPAYEDDRVFRWPATANSLEDHPAPDEV